MTGPFEIGGQWLGGVFGGGIGALGGGAAGAVEGAPEGALIGTAIEPGFGTAAGAVITGGAGAIAEGTVGEAVGQRIGSAVGKGVGGWIDRKLGWGDQTLCGGNCMANEKKEEDAKKDKAKKRADDIVRNPGQFEGEDKADVEKQLDQDLRDDAGWNKAPLKNGSGSRYTSPDGNQQVRLNDGYPGGSNQGPSDPIHSGPYINTPSNGIRVPLKGNPALNGS